MLVANEPKTQQPEAFEKEVRGGFWGTPEEARAFLHLDKEQEVWDLANRSLSARRCSGIFDERDIQRIGKRKFRVYCCKPTIAGDRRPRINVRKG